MMNARKNTLLFAAVMMIVVLASPAQSQTGIIVNNADAVRHENMELSTDLRSVTGSVMPRIVLQYVNTVRQTALVAPSGELRALLGRVTDRIILQYANTSRQMTLAYPAAFIGDTIPPQISNVQTQNVAGGVKITWTTDEFATSDVRWGTVPGTYLWVGGSRLYEKQHEVPLLGLTPGTTYYFVAFSIDRSGNQSVTGESQFQVLVKTYLPVVLRGG